MRRYGYKRRTKRRGPNGRRRNRLNIFASVYDAKQMYTVRLSQNQPVSSNGAGTVAVIIPNDPFTASFTEYTADFVNLFNQFRLVGTRIHLVSTIETKAQTGALAVGYQNRNTGLAAPTAFNNVLDNQPSCIWAVSNDTSQRGLVMKQKMNHILFSATSNSANTSTDSSGAPGGWQLYGSGFPASSSICILHQEVWLEMRSRS